jgi:hypothetical protein
MMTGEVPRQLVLACALVLGGLGAAYQVKGNVDLIAGTSPSSAIDLKNRDMEQAFFTAGKDPHDFMTGSQPPWAYEFGLLLTWPEWPAVRAYFAIVNLIALAFLMWWAYHLPRDATTEARLLLMSAVGAFGGSCTATEVGQVSIIVTALLAGALLSDRSGRAYLCGLLVGLAMIKPTISAPFALALLVTARYRAAIAAAAYGLLASAITWTVTGASPVHMLQQMAAGSTTFINDGTLGLVDIASLLGVSPAVTVVLPLLVAVPGLALMAMVRPSLPLAFAVASVWGRLWTYHKSYDDMMLAFVLVPLGAYALSRLPSRAALAAFLAMGALAWIPGRLLALVEVQMLQLAVWPIALAVLVALSRQHDRSAVMNPHTAPLERLHA